MKKIWLFCGYIIIFLLFNSKCWSEELGDFLSSDWSFNLKQPDFIEIKNNNKQIQIQYKKLSLNESLSLKSQAQVYLDKLGGFDLKPLLYPRGWQFYFKRNKECVFSIYRNKLNTIVMTLCGQPSKEELSIIHKETMSIFYKK